MNDTNLLTNEAWISSIIIPLIHKYNNKISIILFFLLHLNHCISSIQNSILLKVELIFLMIINYLYYSNSSSCYIYEYT